MALKQHIVAKDAAILEAIQTASLQWNYFSSRFYDSPSQLLRVRPLGLAWLLLQYDWESFDTGRLLEQLSQHEEWKEVPCLLFCQQGSVASAEQAGKLFPKTKAIVPLPVRNADLIEVFKGIIEGREVKLAASAPPVPKVVPAQAPLPASGPGPQPTPAKKQSEPLTSSGSIPRIAPSGAFAPPKMPAPPSSSGVAPALPGLKAASRAANPFLAFKQTASLPVLSSAATPSFPKHPVPRIVPQPKIVQPEVHPAPTTQPQEQPSYSDFALAALPVFAVAAEPVAVHPPEPVVEPPPVTTPPPRPQLPPAAESSRPRSSIPRAAQPSQSPPLQPPPPAPALEDPAVRYSDVPLTQLRNTQSLPKYVPSPNAVAFKAPVAPQGRVQGMPPIPKSADLPDTEKWPPELLQAVETKLAELIGPLARILVKKAGRTYSDWPSFYQNLLSHINNPEEQQDFMDFCARLPVPGQSEGGDEEALLKQCEAFDIPVTSDLVRLLEEALYQHVGALGKVLLRQQVIENRRSTGLIRGLLPHIASANERLLFLQRAIAALRR